MAFDPNFRMNRIDQGPSMTEIVNRGAGGILSRQVDRMTAAEDKKKEAEYKASRNKTLDTRADVNTKLQQEAGVRQATAFDNTQTDRTRLLDQRQATSDLYNMQDPANARLTSDVNSAYASIGEPMVKAPDGGMIYSPAQNEQVSALNSRLYKDLGDGTSVDNTKANTILNRDPIAFKKQAMDELMATGKFTGQQAEEVVATEMARRYPVASAEDMKSANETADNTYNANTELLGKSMGGSNNTNISIGGNGSSYKERGRSFDQNTNEHAAKRIDTILNGSNDSGSVGTDSTWFTDDKKNAAEANSFLSKNHVSAPARAEILRLRLKEGKLFGDNWIDVGDRGDFLNEARAIDAGLKGGVAPRDNSSENSTILQLRANQNEKSYLANKKAVRRSGLRGTADKSSMSNFFGKDKVKEKKKSTDKILTPVEKNGTKDDKILANSKTSMDKKYDEYVAEADSKKEDVNSTVASEIPRLQSIINSPKSSTKDINMAKKTAVNISNGMKMTTRMNSSGLQRPTEANKKRWAAIGNLMLDGADYTTSGVQNILGDIAKASDVTKEVLSSIFTQDSNGSLLKPSSTFGSKHGANLVAPILPKK